MFSNVARPPQFQPRHLDHQLPFDSLNTPYDLTESAWPATYGHHGVRSHPHQQIQQRYAYPVQRTNSNDAASQNNAKSSNASEHTLRRKTPNGTLAAGYDGTPVDKTIQQPATKHILVSSPGEGRVLSPQSALSLDLWQQHPLDQSSTGFSQNFPPPYNYDAGRNNGFSTGISPGGSWIRALNNYAPGIDSVLNQTLPMQSTQRYYFHHGSTIPTVLPATLQPFPGPTASAGAGPYGPYWPDGVYIPYRPAAQRDSRFQNLAFHGTAFLGSGLHDVYQSAVNRASVPPSNLDTPPQYTFNQASSNLAQTLQHQNYPTEHFSQPSFPKRHIQKQSFDSFRDQPVPLSYHNRSQYPESESFPNTFSHSILDWQHVGDHGSHQPPTADTCTRSGNAEFKEKVLSWAHSVYVDLLANLHHAKRNNMYKGQGDGHGRHSSKPNIYPKPPRQPGSDFSAQQNQNEAAHHHNQHSGAIESQNSNHQFSHKMMRQEDGAELRHGDQNSRPNTAIHSPSRANSNNFDSRGQFGQSRHSLNTSSNYPVDYRTLRRTSSSAVSRVYSPQQSEASIMTSAMAALEMLTNLCQESGWEWIDGMLLGGCLAYGLGDYNKAMRWYSRILARDSSHVEAISNLAATLLSLNRREEALQYWLRAVKLRPSYFEAVEHLIGLLCGNQRGKEAVNIIEFVEQSLRLSKNGDFFKPGDQQSETDSETKSRSSSVTSMESIERAAFDYEDDDERPLFNDTNSSESTATGFGSSGYAIPGSENGRILALVHAKGNMLYALGDNSGAAAAFEDAILIGAGRRRHGIRSLIGRILSVFNSDRRHGFPQSPSQNSMKEPILLLPDKALQTSKLVFPHHGNLPGLEYVPNGLAKKAAISTTSNSLLSLAKIYQDGMSSTGASGGPKAASGVRDILALYYLSLALQPSPSTANNVGILLASVQQGVPAKASLTFGENQIPDIPGVIPGSGIALALAYYNYGLNLDARHAHLYTNLGSLLKDIGQLPAAIKMYEQAVQCDGNFDIALANLANAVKDQGRINDAIGYYRRAVTANPDFAEAVCGLANALNSVCGWAGRGGIIADYGLRDRWHVDEKGMLLDAKGLKSVSSGWIKRVVEIVEKQLKDGETWGRGALMGVSTEVFCQQLTAVDENSRHVSEKRSSVNRALQSWSGHRWEGSRIVRLIERACKRIGWQWYQDRFIHRKEYGSARYARPQLPAGLSSPNAPTVLPFHTFTCPLSAKQIRQISQRNGLRISCSTLRSSWLPRTVCRPPSPPNPHLNVGYVSSDFNNHPLAHLMQSAFGFHDTSRVKAFCYATTASDNSVHRKQIEKEAPVFHDASTWSIDRLVEQIVKDGIHILINLNGYTRGARNEVFAARPAPIHMSFMGFAGTLGAEWCDYILADEITIPQETLSPWRRNVDLEDRITDESNAEDQEDWVYGENIIFARDTFFCCDHRQSAPDSQDKRLPWEEEQVKRWQMRKELFPTLSDDAIILGNFNQLYKIEPTTFRTWLRILARIPRAILWLLRFPDLGEQNLKRIATDWAGESIASRIVFTDVAPKHQHISRARVCDLFLDTPECNAHTTAADVLWSGTPLLTLPRYKYKMCSRMAASILTSALPKNDAGKRAAKELIAGSDEEYEQTAIRLGNDLVYDSHGRGMGKARLVELRKILYESRWSSALFDTRRWVRDLESSYEEAWRRWVRGDGGDIWL